MPIYEYVCTKCGLIMEKYRNTIHAKNPSCDECGGFSQKLVSMIGRINMNPGPVSGLDDTDELTLGKIVANKGMPAEHKRQYREIRERRARASEYEKGLQERAKKYNFDPKAE